jgi:exopolyphosphatase / guanosine-5'-triphosphate,3'-diphosphate pyrophosphatase
MAGMRVGVVDVGSNTVRLLVAWTDGRRCRPVRQQKLVLRLGACVEEHGRIPIAKLAETADRVRDLVRNARRDCDAVEVLVTSPGRQAENGGDLLAALERAGQVPVRLLSAEDEGRLAYEGALAALEDVPSTVAVVDVGGGSTQLVVGTREDGPVWFRSIDVGSLRLTTRVLDRDPPGQAQLDLAAEEVATLFSGVVPPAPQAAIAVGGSARGLRRLNGPYLEARSIAEIQRKLAEVASEEVAERYDLPPARARTVAAGSVILAEVQRRLAVPMSVGRGGIRDGAVLALARRAAAAA